MKNAQNEVVAWWYGRRDYRTGIELLSRYCKNKTIINTLSKHGKERFQASVKKLHYEVTKSVQLDWLHMPDDELPAEPDREKSLADIPPVKIQEEKNIPSETSFLPEQEKKIDDANQYPRVIRRLKYEYSELYNKRSQLHANLHLVEQYNSESNNATRAGLLSEIKALSNKLAVYWEFTEAYEKTGVVPEESEIWPPEKLAPPDEPKTLPELIKHLRSLKSEISKDGFRLLYQQRTKGEKENPMPPGPKRDKVELKIENSKIKISQTMALIAQLENAG